MNDKLAKALRKAAGYRNQSATPGVCPFPGIARMYTHPVYSTRSTKKSSYIRLPMGEKFTKVFTTVTRLVLDSRGKPVIEMGAQPDPKTGAIVPKTNLVPVVKPARLEQQSPKGMYRALKRLARKKMLAGLGAWILQSHQLQKEVQA